VLTCGVPSISTAVPRGKGEDGESCSEDESSEENQTVGCFVLLFFFSSFNWAVCNMVSFSFQFEFFKSLIIIIYATLRMQVCISDRNRPKKKQKITRKGKGKDWIFKKKEQLRRKGNAVPPDTRYTGRKRKARF